jgi:[acyl-carrier-protein] S-malonyltransferase
MTLRPEQLRAFLPATAFSFRGYNVTNLGRTPELLAHSKFGPVVERALRQGSELASDTLNRRIDLVERIRHGRETHDLTTYAEDVALIVSVELAQLQLFEECVGRPFTEGRLAFGYSLGEAGLLIAAKMFGTELLRIPIALAADSVALAHDTTMGVLFSRGAALDASVVNRLCSEINQRGEGVIGVSTMLSPNCVLLLGQRETVDVFREHMKLNLPKGTTLRKNPHRWPPIHTSITWQKAIPNRAAVMLQTTPGGSTAPPLAIVSGVTGKPSFSEHNARELMHRWVDHPQLLWEQVVHVLASGVRLVIHVGPDPNLIPATFKRLSEDVRGQLSAKFGLRVVSHMVRRPWLAQLLPANAVLLRAPVVQHVNLEDWLLDAH